MGFKIREYAHLLSSDSDPKSRTDARSIDGYVNRCVIRATEALKHHPSSHGDLDRSHLSAIFEAMRYTHQNIRLVVSPGEPKPSSVDALSLSRLQLESLCAICLMIENAKWVQAYAKDGWKKRYKRYLLVS